MKNKDKKYYIIALRNVYTPDTQGLGRPYPVADERGKPEVYALDQARAEIGRLDNEVYYASNGEASRPEYLIIDADDWEYQQYRALDTYAWPDEMECGACGECNQCCAVIIDQDREWTKENSLNS